MSVQLLTSKLARISLKRGYQSQCFGTTRPIFRSSQSKLPTLFGSPYILDILEREAQWLKHAMDESNCDKWGFVVYRCTYKDNDVKWQRFKDLLISRNRQQLLPTSLPGLADQMDWKFVEDPSLEGAGPSILRPLFLAWRQTACAEEQPRADFSTPWPNMQPRYLSYFFVDSENLESILDRAEDATAQIGHSGHVNFAEALIGDDFARTDDGKTVLNVISYPEDSFGQRFDDDSEDYPAFFLRWARIEAWQMGVFAYNHTSQEEWDIAWERPPRLTIFTDRVKYRMDAKYIFMSPSFRYPRHHPPCPFLRMRNTYSGLHSRAR